MRRLPKISVVTPSFNKGRFLERTIVSVLSQSYPNKEYILMDGGSQDDSVEIIRRYQAGLAYWESGPDKGQTDAICRGFAKATGDILLYLNSDDMLLPGALWRYADALADVRQGWAIGRVMLIDEEDRCLASRPTFPFSIGDLWYNLYIIPQEATCFTKDLYQEIGGFDPAFHYAMDFHAWLRMRSLFKPILIDQYTAAFRVAAGQKSADGTRYAEEVDRAFCSIRKWRIGRGMLEFPQRPLFPGPMLSLAKCIHYFWTGGISAVAGMGRFRMKAHGNAMKKKVIRSNRRH